MRKRSEHARDDEMSERIVSMREDEMSEWMK